MNAQRCFAILVLAIFCTLVVHCGASTQWAFTRALYLADGVQPPGAEGNLLPRTSGLVVPNMHQESLRIGSDTAKGARPPEVRYGIEFTCMPREYVPQLVIHANFGWFAIEHTSNFTLLTDNPQDSGKDAFSWMGVVDVGAVMFGSMVHRDDAGALRDVIAYGIILPIFALNPRIVLNIAGGEGSFAGSARIHASLFAGMRTDIYHANITWVRWNPGCGVRCGWRVAEEKDAGILGVSCGVESPHDLFTGGPTARWSRVALGLHYGF